MLTPQDIQNKEFVKAVFGGYDMTVVDDFLEEIAGDYATLSKENAVLKSKIKVLVEKIEEYRSTEDAMRAALLSAQKMSDDMLADAQKKSEEMIAEAEKKSKQMVENSEYTVREQMRQCDKKLEFEKKRLQEAQEKTVLFLQASRQIMEKHASFIDRLEELKYKTEEPKEEKKAEEPAPAVEAKPAPAVQPEKPAAPAAPQMTQSEIDREKEIVDTAKEIDKAVADLFRDDNDAPATENTVVFRTKDTTVDWSDDDEPTSPRPKFNFDDLKFGSNYDE